MRWLGGKKCRVERVVALSVRPLALARGSKPPDKRFSDRHPPDLSRWFAGTGKTFSREVWARDNCAVVSGPDLSVKLISVPEKLFSVPDQINERGLDYYAWRMS